MFQAVEFNLLGDQKALGDMIFFVFGVAGQTDNFHAVLQRQRNIRQGVGRCNKKDVRKIVIHIQIMVIEAEVLLGIQNLQQRRRRIASEIHAHFIDFVQTEYRIVYAGLFQ